MAEIEKAAKAAAKKSWERQEYIVVDNPFFDGVQLHEPGSRIVWAGPPGNSLHPVKAGRRKSTTEAPVFPNALAGRGDGAVVEAAKPGQPQVFTQ